MLYKIEYNGKSATSRIKKLHKQLIFLGIFRIISIVIFKEGSKTPCKQHHEKDDFHRTRVKFEGLTLDVDLRKGLQ